MTGPGVGTTPLSLVKHSRFTPASPSAAGAARSKTFHRKCLQRSGKVLQTPSLRYESAWRRNDVDGLSLVAEALSRLRAQLEGRDRFGSASPPIETCREDWRSPMRCFTLHRCEDETGVSGTGVVAWGVQWPDGSVSLRWHGATPSFVSYEGVDGSAVRQAIQHVQHVHGHHGKTVVRWREAVHDDRKTEATPVKEIPTEQCTEAIRRSEGVLSDESEGPGDIGVPRHRFFENLLRLLRW